MKFVRWDEGDLPVEAFCELWNAELAAHFPISKRLFIQNSIDCPHLFSDGSWYAVAEDRVIGFVTTKYTNEQEDLLPTEVGWIQALLVQKEFRNHGIGSQLLEKAERALSDLGVDKVLIGGDIHHYFPGVPSLVSNMGQWLENRKYSKVNEVKDFYRAAPSQAEEISVTNITLSSVSKDEEVPFLLFMEDAFPGRWEYEAREYFNRGGDGSHFIAARYGDEIIGFVHLNDLDSPVIGPNLYWYGLFKEKLGGIGPLGIKEDYRKNGYGAAIVQKAINTAIERGCKHLVIDWTELDEFYMSFGFEPWKEFLQYEKCMNNG
ncbi:GNAT family N-acetyltransferase [Pseudalkalibacillus salsuginis]|uniref:GNAT family N-acetyltransferase n=1 Tax=Pseudalkalibacillus salsuginis TaxID=2910972 RepID=UPI001F1DAF10|nr:GNAT family N-acetyltransferase [Pseudalkalibacillus salsuginis]MCF6408339.1 GNAT family N-acetyltransferase [Pseudalkalibacillus salsuginis]